MANRLGNVSPGKRSVGTGSGVPHRRAPFGHVTIAGTTGEVVRISAEEIFNGISVGEVLIQVTGGSVRVSRTLADTDLAMSKDQDTGGHWVVALASLTPGSIQNLGIGTAYMIEFISNGVVYISGV